MLQIILQITSIIGIANIANSLWCCNPFIFLFIGFTNFFSIFLLLTKWITWFAFSSISRIWQNFGMIIRDYFIFTTFFLFICIAHTFNFHGCIYLRIWHFFIYFRFRSDWFCCYLWWHRLFYELFICIILCIILYDIFRYTFVIFKVYFLCGIFEAKIAIIWPFFSMDYFMNFQHWRFFKYFTTIRTIMAWSTINVNLCNVNISSASRCKFFLTKLTSEIFIQKIYEFGTSLFMRRYFRGWPFFIAILACNNIQIIFFGIAWIISFGITSYQICDIFRCTFVISKVHFLSVLFEAKVATEWPYSSMDYFMNFQFWRTIKSFTTNGTIIVWINCLIFSLLNDFRRDFIFAFMNIFCLFFTDFTIFFDIIFILASPFMHPKSSPMKLFFTKFANSFCFRITARPNICMISRFRDFILTNFFFFINNIFLLASPFIPNEFVIFWFFLHMFMWNMSIGHSSGFVFSWTFQTLIWQTS